MHYKKFQMCAPHLRFLSVCVSGSATEGSLATGFTSWVSTSSVTSRVAVVMTDGNSNVDSGRTASEAVALHQAGVHVITVCVGQIYNATELRAIASRNGTLGNVFHVESYDQLEALASSVQAAICNGQFTLAYLGRSPTRHTTFHSGNDSFQSLVLATKLPKYNDQHKKNRPYLRTTFEEQTQNRNVNLNA